MYIYVYKYIVLSHIANAKNSSNELKVTIIQKTWLDLTITLRLVNSFKAGRQADRQTGSQIDTLTHTLYSFLSDFKVLFSWKMCKMLK